MAGVSTEEPTLELEETDEDGIRKEAASPDNSPVKAGLELDNKKSRRLSTFQKVVIFFQVGLLILMNYLLLVFLPGSAFLSALAMIVLWILVLRAQILEEFRRQRLDRLLTMISLFLIIAGGLTLSTYSRLALKEGQIYEGPARIVGYDDTVYQNTDGETLRADLEVAWGGSWGCPENGMQCQAFVHGALCETKYEVDGGSTRRRQRNRRRTDADQDEVELEEEEIEEEAEVEYEEAEMEAGECRRHEFAAAVPMPFRQILLFGDRSAAAIRILTHVHVLSLPDRNCGGRG
jgi:hypothetical protein